MDSVRKYLEDKGWTIHFFTDKLSKIKKSLEEEEFEIVIPNSEGFSDYLIRINDLICTLSSIEERTENDIAEDIQNIGYDLMK